MSLLGAGGLVGTDIRIDKDRNNTVATVEIYPHNMKVSVKRDEPYKNLLNKIEAALLELYAARNVQF